MNRHNFRNVISFEVVRTLTKRRFWISTLIVPLMIGLVAALIVLSNSSTKQAVDLQKTAKFTFVYTDKSGYVDPAIVGAFGGSLAADPTRALADVKAGRLDAYFAYPANPLSQPTQVYAADKGIFNNGKYSTVAKQILVASARARIGDPKLTSFAQGRVNIASTTYKQGAESGSPRGLIPPLFLLVIFYVVIVLLGNQMLTSTLEEKENRVTEMILTTINPTTLIAGKVVSLFIIGAVQVLVFATPMVIAFIFFRSALNLPNLDLSTLQFNPGQLTIGALLLLGGFTLFTGTLVAVGAAMPTAKEAGQLFGVLMTLIFVPFWIVSLVVSDPNALIVTLFTYFPYSAPVTAMLRNGFGSLSAVAAVIVIVELFVLGVFALRVAARLFRYGSIEYTRKVSIRTAFARPNRG
jgi:ABC-2 type transport system permease protein